MKKFKYFSLLGVLLSILLLLTSCNNKTVASPTKLEIDIDNKLTWQEVDNARTYVIDITGVDVDYQNAISSRKTSYSLSKLSEGDYIIKVKAVDEAKNESNWSEALEFHRDYESGCIYTLINNNSEYEVTRAGSADGKVIIGDTYRGKPVTTIGDNAFKGNGKVESVVLGKYVTKIGDNAFYNCSNLKEINLPDTLTYIGVAAFQACRSLKEITIPSGVQMIYDYTFAYCRDLSTIIFNEGLLYISECGFSDCYSLKEINLPDSLLYVGVDSFSNDANLESVSFGSGLLAIDTEAFFKCASLADVKFAEESSLLQIGQFAFSECSSIKEIAIPGSVQYISDRCFYSATSLENITIPESVIRIGHHVFNNTKLYNDQTGYVYADKWIVDYKGEISEIGKTDLRSDTFGIADWAFQNKKQLKSVQIPTSVKIVGSYAFAYCSALYSFKTATNSLQYIWDCAFVGDGLLSQLTLSAGLEYIGNNAFYNCTLVDNSDMRELIPSTVNTIGSNAFEGTKLWKSPNSEGIIYAGKWVVGLSNEAKKKTELTLNTDTVGIANYAFAKCDQLKTVTRLASAKYIGYGAFYKCSSLQTITLNKNLKKIEPYTFYMCSELFNVSFPSALTEIGERAFYKCTTMYEVDMSSTRVTAIGDSAFYGCENINKLSLPKTLTEIGIKSFYKNTSLKDVVLPDALENMGQYSFYKCTALESVTIGSGISEIAPYTFSGCASLKSVEIPNNVTTIGRSAFYKCDSVENITFGNSVTTIDSYAFFGMDKLTNLVIPENVKTIGSFAFKGAVSLKSVVLLDTIETIEKHAFYGCKNLTIYTNVKEDNEGWKSMYNSSNRPIIYGCELEDGNVVSFEKKETSVVNQNAKSGINGPEKSGYKFAGWQVVVVDDEGNESTIIVEADKIVEIENDKKFVAIYVKEE